MVELEELRGRIAAATRDGDAQYCAKRGAQIPDGSMFCTSCSARVGGVEDQAEPVTFPVGDAPATAPAGQRAPQGHLGSYGGAVSL